MNLFSVKELKDLRKVLSDQLAVGGPDPAYWVFKGIDGGWVNMTVLASGKHGQEYNKTFGHYHLNPPSDEKYHVVSGEGYLVLQNEDEFKLVKLIVGQTYPVSHEFGHCLINTGAGPLITFDDRIEPHPHEDYEIVEKTQGLAYYVVEKDGKVDVSPNPHYQKMPEVKWENN